MSRLVVCFRLVVALCCALAGCAAATAPTSRVEQVQKSCAAAMAELENARASGTPCPFARAAALELHPDCPLSFVCRAPAAADAGPDAGDGGAE